MNREEYLNKTFPLEDGTTYIQNLDKHLNVTNKVMAKRLTLQEKKDIFIVDVINKMFEISGYDVTYEDIKDRKDDWYTQWTMTMEQSDEWRDWGVSEIQKRFRYNKKWAEREMGMITLMWGLKFSDFPTEE